MIPSVTANQVERGIEDFLRPPSRGYLYCSGRFIREMENVSYRVAAGNIDKDLLYEIISAVIKGDENEDSSQYERLALSRDKKQVKKLSEKGQLVGKAADLLKEPYVLEFLGLDEKNAYSESDQLYRTTADYVADRIFA